MVLHLDERERVTLGFPLRDRGAALRDAGRDDRAAATVGLSWDGPRQEWTDGSDVALSPAAFDVALAALWPALLKGLGERLGAVDAREARLAMDTLMAYLLAEEADAPASAARPWTLRWSNLRQQRALVARTLTARAALRIEAARRA